MVPRTLDTNLYGECERDIGSYEIQWKIEIETLWGYLICKYLPQNVLFVRCMITMTDINCYVNIRHQKYKTINHKTQQLLLILRIYHSDQEPTLK